MPRTYTKAQKESAKKWDANNLDRISIAVKKGGREEIRAHAEQRGESMNGFICRAIGEQMNRDSEQKEREQCTEQKNKLHGQLQSGKI